AGGAGLRDRRTPRRAARSHAGRPRRRAAHRLRDLALPLRPGPTADPAPLRRRRDALAPRAARRAGAGRTNRGRPDRHLYCGSAWWTRSRLVPAPPEWGRETPL